MRNICAADRHSRCWGACHHQFMLTHKPLVLLYPLLYMANGLCRAGPARPEPDRARAFPPSAQARPGNGMGRAMRLAHSTYRVGPA
jgi:hypothetical protein